MLFRSAATSSSNASAQPTSYGSLNNTNSTTQPNFTLSDLNTIIQTNLNVALAGVVLQINASNEARDKARLDAETAKTDELLALNKALDSRVDTLTTTTTNMANSQNETKGLLERNIKLTTLSLQKLNLLEKIGRAHV